MKTLLDSNIIIFLGTDKAAQIENILVDKELNVSVITKVETPARRSIAAAAVVGRSLQFRPF